jgi:cytochrome c5
MDRRRLTGVLGGALALSIGLNVVVRLPVTRPNFEYFPDMARTVRYNAFEENPNFSDGMTLRVPVPGTMPRGIRAFASIGELATENAFAAGDAAALARGAVVYGNFCQPCPGVGGQGEGPVVLRGFPAAPTLYRAAVRRLGDDRLFGIVTNGQNAMPSYATLLSPDDRWKVILHVRTLRPPAAPTGGAP